MEHGAQRILRVRNAVVIICTSAGAVAIIFLIFQLLRLQMMLHFDSAVQPISFKRLKITSGPRNVESRAGREARGVWGRRKGTPGRTELSSLHAVRSGGARLQGTATKLIPPSPQ